MLNIYNQKGRGKTYKCPHCECVNYGPLTNENYCYCHKCSEEIKYGESIWKIRGAEWEIVDGKNEGDKVWKKL